LPLLSQTLGKIEGLSSLLGSLSMDEEPGKVYHVVYSSFEFLGPMERELGYWYSEGHCTRGTLLRLISERFKAAGHPHTNRLVDGLILAFVLMPKTGDAVADFAKVLSSFTAASVQQFVLLPSSALLRLERTEGPPEHDIIGLFGHGPFRYGPFAGGLLDGVKARLANIGMGDLSPELDKFFGCLALYRTHQGTNVINFAELGFRGNQAPEIVELMQHYFDDLSIALFDGFWREHLESQYWYVAAGADLLDRALLESLTKTSWLSVYWGFEVLSGKGTISLLTEQSQLTGTLALRVHTLGKALSAAREVIKAELASPGAALSYPSLMNFARLVARSRVLQTREYIEESFTLLMVALESLLVDRDSMISLNLRQRVGAVLAISQDRDFDDASRQVVELYNHRSNFVHGGRAISVCSLEALQKVCRTVFFAACRSQKQSAQAGDDENAWRIKWLGVLDYVAACFKAGITVDSGAAVISGALRNWVNPNHS
jgi:hypothetical protein